MVPGKNLTVEFVAQRHLPVAREKAKVFDQKQLTFGAPLLKKIKTQFNLKEAELLVRIEI